MIQKVSKAVIPVAGLGTRMLPATKAIPKELLPVYDRPIIEHVVREAVAAGMTEIILVTRSGKEAIENHFDANFELEHRLDQKGKESVLSSIKDILPKAIKVASIRQHDALGLGHAVLCAAHLVGREPFAVLLPDVLVLDKTARSNGYSFKSLADAWNRTGVAQIMVEPVAVEDVEKYGIIDSGNADHDFFTPFMTQGVVEKPSREAAPSNMAVLGRYVLPNQVMALLENTPAGAGGEIQLTDALNVLAEQGELGAFKTDAATFDCGNKSGFLAANMAVGMRDEATRAYVQGRFNGLDRFSEK